MFYVVKNPSIMPVFSENGVHWNMSTNDPPEMTVLNPLHLNKEVKKLEFALDEACDILGDGWCPRFSGLARLEECDNPEHDCLYTNNGECWRQYFIERAKNKVVE